jgi:hypothetical protein
MQLLGAFIIFLSFNINCSGQKDFVKAENNNEIYLEHNDPGVLNEATNQTQLNWELLTINNETVLRSLTKYELDLKCEASFPIEWNITGHIVRKNLIIRIFSKIYFSLIKQQDPEFVVIQPYKRDIVDENGSLQFLFKIHILIFFDPDASVTLASSRIFCQRVGKPEINKHYAIFLRGI